MSADAVKIEDLPHYTYDDYVEWEGRWELIHGIPYAMVPAPIAKHQRVCGKIHRQVDELLDYCELCEALWPMDWPIEDDTVVQPDVFVVCGGDIGDKRLEVTPVLVFEVLSPSTSKKDRGIKYRLYEAAGVKYYCIVDPEAESVDVFVLKEDKYRHPEEFKDHRMWFDLGPCKIAVDFKKIFKF